MPPQTVIAVDAMGGDFGPPVTVPAVVDFLNAHLDATVLLYGREADIRGQLPGRFSDSPQKLSERLHIVHCGQSVSSDAIPSKALRAMRESSMWQALQAVSEGKVEACVSAGETGSLMAMSVKNLGTLPGIARPAICSPLPTSKGHSYILDLGANVDCSADQLHQFATMATIMVKAQSARESSIGKINADDSLAESPGQPKASQPKSCSETVLPSVALLNVGMEDHKGNRVVREAAELLRGDKNLNYVGFIEPDSLYSGNADIVVCDGFIGNVALKTTEGVAHLLIDFIRSQSGGYGIARLRGLLLKPLVKRVINFLDPCHYNGASLLGLRGTVVKSHGAADRPGFVRALEVALGEVADGLCKQLDARLE